ncbi:MAG: membrane dipeptidase [Clostridia bacterium]|nr:membrane dipeptidase [Clostridia bacterium]
MGVRKTYFLDMHCDTLTERGKLVNEYNFSNLAGQLQVFAAFVPNRARAPEVRRAELMFYARRYKRACEWEGLYEVKSKSDLKKAKETGERAAIFAVEGGGGLFAPSWELEALYAMGLRILGLAWDDNELSGSSGSERGLTAYGRELVIRAAKMGIIIDISHLSDRAAEEVLEICPTPPIATHSNFREVCPARRNLPLHIARGIAERGGVIGLNLYPPFLNESGSAGWADILRHIDYALGNFGEGVLGLGLDIDGTGGVYPRGFSEGESIHDAVYDVLIKHYPSSVAEGIIGGWAVNFLSRTLP